MACSKLEARGHLLHKTGTPPNISAGSVCISLKKESCFDLILALSLCMGQTWNLHICNSFLLGYFSGWYWVFHQFHFFDLIKIIPQEWHFIRSYCKFGYVHCKFTIKCWQHAGLLSMCLIKSQRDCQMVMRVFTKSWDDVLCIPCSHTVRYQY